MSMVNREELNDIAETIRYDYRYCPLCKNIIHVNDEYCRWCGGKRVFVRERSAVFWFSFIPLFFFLGFFFGKIPNGYLAGIPVIVVFWFLAIRKKKEIWVRRSNHNPEHR
ncbi:hypothetical protein ACSFC0_25970 [Serratia marcescens]|uniref:hypothetical protein n=1 Tax=Serratia marcescens TaxID=615 RepID=UPI003ED9B082